MRILQLAGLAGPDAVAGGVWRVAVTQTEVLREAGDDVALYGGWWGSAHGVDSEADVLFEAREPIPRSGIRTLWAPRLRRALNGVSDSFDMVHIHLARDFITVPSVRILANVGLPVVVQTHGMISDASGLSTTVYDAVFRRGIISRVARWLALTAEEKKALEAWGVPASRISMIRNSVSVSGAEWRRPSVTRFAFVSRLHHRKQPDVFVKALLLLMDNGFDVLGVIAGPDEGMESEVRRLVGSSNHADRFEILGPISAEEVRTLVTEVSAVVLPSVNEIVPMIALECASVGTPLILTRDSGLSIEFAEADAAEVVEPTVEGVRRAMQRLIKDGERLEDISVAAQNLFVSRWGPTALARSLRAEYARAIG